MTQTGRPDTLLTARPPDPPRPLTSRVRRRSWGELQVRPWWIGAGVLAALAMYLVGGRLGSSLRDWSLLRRGVRVDALVVAANNNPLLDKEYLPEVNAEFEMHADLPGQDKPVIIVGRLKDQRHAVTTGKRHPLIIDPTNPSRWTDRVQASFHEDMIVAAMLLPPAFLMFLVALFLRRRVLQVWKTGQAMAAVAMDVRQSPLAPLSRMVRFTLRDAREHRIYRILVPARCGALRPGDGFWVIAPPDKPASAMAAAAYLEE